MAFAVFETERARDQVLCQKHVAKRKKKKPSKWIYVGETLGQTLQNSSMIVGSKRLGPINSHWYVKS